MRRSRALTGGETVKGIARSSEVISILWGGTLQELLGGQVGHYSVHIGSRVPTQCSMDPTLQCSTKLVR